MLLIELDALIELTCALMLLIRVHSKTDIGRAFTRHSYGVLFIFPLGRHDDDDEWKKRRGHGLNTRITRRMCCISLFDTRTIAILIQIFHVVIVRGNNRSFRLRARGSYLYVYVRARTDGYFGNFVLSNVESIPSLFLLFYDTTGSLS